MFILSFSVFAQETESVAGLIKDRVLQSPILGARIMIDGKRRAVTDEDGAFLIELPTSPYNLSVEAAGYEKESKEIEVFSGKTIEVVFELIPSLTFYGEEFVVEAPEPTPAEEVIVSKETVEENEIKDNRSAS